MQWSDVSLQPSQRILRQFAALWTAFFLASAALSVFWRWNPFSASVFAALALSVGPLGLLNPAAVRWVYVAWMVLAFPIGWTVSRIMLAILFYGLFTPVALSFRVAGRDALSRRGQRPTDSYWTMRDLPKDVRSYFRQS